jgi:ABC-type transporter Mla MlaB component
MLKITTRKESRATVFELEGRLAGPWVAELERCWSTMPALQKEASVCVDLTGVTYIDAEGKGLLEKMHRYGADLIAAGCLTKCVVEEIMRAGPYDAVQGCDARDLPQNAPESEHKP